MQMTVQVKFLMKICALLCVDATVKYSITSTLPPIEKPNARVLEDIAETPAAPAERLPKSEAITRVTIGRY